MFFPEIKMLSKMTSFKEKFINLITKRRLIIMNITFINLLKEKKILKMLIRLLPK